MPIFVTSTQFSGLSNTYGKGKNSLSSIVRGLAQFQARTAVVSAAIPALTDSTGAAAPDSVLSIVQGFTPAVLVGSDCVAKADIEAAFGTVLSALASVAVQANLTAAAVPAFAPLVSGLGAGSGTVTAITKAFVGANAGLASATGSAPVLAAVNATTQELAYFVNALALAVGVAPLTGINAPSFDGLVPAVPVNTGAAVTGATATAIKATEAGGVFSVLASNARELVATLNAVRAVTPVINVIAS